METYTYFHDHAEAYNLTFTQASDRIVKWIIILLVLISALLGKFNWNLLLAYGAWGASLYFQLQCLQHLLYLKHKTNYPFNFLSLICLISLAIPCLVFLDWRLTLIAVSLLGMLNILLGDIAKQVKRNRTVR